MPAWPVDGPRVLWSTPVCEGYAAAAIVDGRVFFHDYSQDAGEWYVRCLTLEEGQELWRFAEKKRIRPNHGITRTSPAVDGKYVFSLDPKCVFHCLDAATGRELWQKSLVADYGAQIPPWYNGQNPLLEPDRVVLGVGGDALLVALDKATGDELWRTPNPQRWPLSHSSVMPAELAGVKQYLWCTLFGPLGVRAADGELLWHHPRKFNVAVAPSPLPIGDDRVFMTAGYDAGSVMLRVTRDGERFTTQVLFELSSEQWNSEVHTPILYQNHLFAVGRKSRGLFTCLDLNGEVVWTSEGRASFELGSFLLADGMFFILEGKTGVLRLVEASTREYRELASAPVLGGDNVWGPMALSNGKLVLRDMTRMVCIDVGQPAATAPYRRLRVISSAGHFREELRGLATDAADRLYAVGDSKAAVFTSAGEILQTWPTERPGYSVAVAGGESVYVGEPGQIELFTPDGKLQQTWRDPENFGLVTAIAFVGDEVIVADTKARCLRRCDRHGRVQQSIGADNRMRGFLLPNQHLDLAVDGRGTIHAPNPGRHRVERYSVTGELLGYFGRLDGVSPEGFPGCCNPTNIALTPGGDIIVTEKADPRVKVYAPHGGLKAVFGQDDFDPQARNMDIAVDSRGRIYVADTHKLQIVVYEPETSASQPASAPNLPGATR